MKLTILSVLSPLTSRMVNVHQLINNTVSDTKKAKQDLRTKIDSARLGASKVFMKGKALKVLKLIHPDFTYNAISTLQKQPQLSRVFSGRHVVEERSPTAHHFIGMHHQIAYLPPRGLNFRFNDSLGPQWRAQGPRKIQNETRRTFVMFWRETRGLRSQ